MAVLSTMAALDCENCGTPSLTTKHWKWVTVEGYTHGRYCERCAKRNYTVRDDES